MECNLCHIEINHDTADINERTGKFKLHCRKCSIIKSERSKAWYHKHGGKEGRKKRYTSRVKLGRKLTDEELDKISEEYAKNNTIHQPINYYPNTWNTVQ